MPVLRVIVLWHQHQPFYKDLVTGEYRLPWVRLHALKDYYGMVKLLDEFPEVHQTFNLVPSLIAQIQDYVAGTARDPFLDVASKPASDLTSEERRFALQYLFQANPVGMIGRYPRYRELSERLRGAGSSAEPMERRFQDQDFTDLQVLSQIAWFDEFFLEDPEVAALIEKGRGFSLDDQKFVITRQRELLGKVLPAHAAAVQRGSIEISTSPYYHPIMPLVADTNQGRVSSPGLPLPQNRYRHPEDVREQLLRGLDLHQNVFGARPVGVWPSEGSVSEEVLAIAQSLGVNWMATDEGVLGRSLGIDFARDGCNLSAGKAEKLYTIHRFENGQTVMHMIFRDHTISDLIGFVYSGMPAAEAATHLIDNLKRAAQPVLDKGTDAVISIILDGENAWEHFPKSGREFLRRFYEGLQNDPSIEAVTVSEAIARHKEFNRVSSLVPGSWINANFNVWVGAPEDNKAWDYLYQARNFYSENAARASDAQRKLAFEELLIAEGSDWNWWYGPEHHSANDSDFDELYRKHLSNVYQALGGTPPAYLAQPITAAPVRRAFAPQTSYIHPAITGNMVRYFEWMGAAVYTADRRAGAMHGKAFFLDSAHAGIDEDYVYGRLDFADKPESDFELIVNVESYSEDEEQARHSLRIETQVSAGKMRAWRVTAANQPRPVASSEESRPEIKIAFARNFEFRLPLAWLAIAPVSANGSTPRTDRNRVRLRFSLWQNRLPADQIPAEGWMELQLLSEDELAATVF